MIKRRNTIPLVEPSYCDTIVQNYEIIEGQEGLSRILAQISGQQVKPSYTSTYPYFLETLSSLYSSQGNKLVRNRRGNFVAYQRSIYYRKYAWLQVVCRDEVFKRFFQFTYSPKKKEEIAREFNGSSGKYLTKWGRWLGKTLYLPKLEAYRSFKEMEILSQEQFWKIIMKAYSSLSRESWVGTRRYSVTVGEVRIEVCTRYSVLPLTFDCLLDQLYRGRQHYTKLELIGLPPHRLKQRTKETKTDSIIVDNAEYFYIVIHDKQNEIF